MMIILDKMISTYNIYNILTTNNWCKECTPKEKKVQLSIHHASTVYGVDVGRNIEITILLAKEAYSLLQEIKRDLNSYDLYKNKVSKQNKYDIINKIKNMYFFLFNKRKFTWQLFF